MVQPADTSSPSVPRRSIPLYLRLWFITLLFFFWPGWYPVGPPLAFGLLLARLRSQPRLHSASGWLLLLTGLPFAALGLLGVIEDKSWFAQILFGSMFVGAGFWTGAGAVIAYRARRAGRLVRLIHTKGMRSVAEIAEAGGRTDLRAIAADIQRIERRGWLEGYSFDPISGLVRQTNIAPGFGGAIRRSYLGMASIGLGALIYVLFFAIAPPGSLANQASATTRTTAGAMSFLRELLLPPQLRACEAMPKEQMTAILGRSLVRTRTRWDVGYSECLYSRPQDDKYTATDIITLNYNADRDRAAAKKRRQEVIDSQRNAPANGVVEMIVNLFAGEVARKVYNFADDVRQGTERARAIQEHLGPRYEVIDYLQDGLEVYRRGVAVRIQLTDNTAYQDVVHLIGGPGKTKERTRSEAENMAKIARITLDNALR